MNKVHYRYEIYIETENSESKYKTNDSFDNLPEALAFCRAFWKEWPSLVESVGVRGVWIRQVTLLPTGMECGTRVFRVTEEGKLVSEGKFPIPKYRSIDDE